MPPTESTVQAADSTARPSTAGADGVPADAVEAASAAQLAFLREVLVDTATPSRTALWCHRAGIALRTTLAPGSMLPTRRALALHSGSCEDRAMLREV